MFTTAKRIDLVGRNDFNVEKTAQGLFLHSVPRRSASGLYRPVEMDGAELTRIRWRWRVHKLRETADVCNLAIEHFRAMVMFVFGKPSLMNRNVPTLGYVWTSTPAPNELSNALSVTAPWPTFSCAVEPMSAICGRRRAMSSRIFQAAFGKDPGQLRFIAGFNYNDQTHEDASALFRVILDGR